MAGVPYGMIIGGAMDTIGTALMAGGADKRRREQMDIANTPGLDFGALTQQALQGYNANFDAASGLAGRIGQSNMAQLLGLREQALPGIGAAQRQLLGNAQTLLDPTNAAFMQQMQRTGAAMGMESGLFGSQAGQLQTLNRTFKEQVANWQQGAGLIGALIGQIPNAGQAMQTFLGPTIDQQVAQRASERTQRMQMLSGATAMPTGLETWAQRLQQVGTTLAGASAGSTALGPMSGYGGGYGGGGAMNGFGAMGGYSGGSAGWPYTGGSNVNMGGMDYNAMAGIASMYGA